MENLTLLGIAIIVIWLVIFGYYFFASRQQGEIREEVDDLRQRLDAQEKQPN